MAEFKTIIEAVWRNKEGCEMDRFEVSKNSDTGYVELPGLTDLDVGDTITIEQRETEVV